MLIKRFGDIIATHDDTINNGAGGIMAFHAANLEVADISQEVFDSMYPINIADDEAPNSLISNVHNEETIESVNEWLHYINPNLKSGRINYGIRSITLNVNQICNLKCSYCAAGGDGTYGEAVSQISIKETLPQIEYFISKTPDGDVFAISFIGGEPLLHPATIKAIHDYALDLCRKKNILLIMKIVTNGTLINIETINILKTLQVDLTISMDGRPEVNDVVRPSKDGNSPTLKILAGLELLKLDRGLIKAIHISAVTTADNPALFENFKFIHTLPIDTFDFVFANNEKDLQIQKRYIDDYKKIMEYLWQVGGEAELRRLKSVSSMFNNLDNQQKIENFCGAGKNYAMVDAKNRLYSCVWDANDLSKSIGKKLTINQIELDKLSKPLVELNNCMTCWARNICGGGCMYINKSHSGGDKHQKSKLFCERTRSLILAALVYYKISRAS